MSSIINGGISQGLIILIVSDNTSTGILKDLLLSSNETSISVPVKLLQPVQSTHSVNNDVVLSTIDDSLEGWDGGLGKQVGVISHIALHNIWIEVHISLVNTVLEVFSQINTHNLLNSSGIEPVRIVRRFRLVDFEVIRTDVVVDGGDVVSKFIEHTSGSRPVSDLDVFSDNVLIKQDLSSGLVIRVGGGISELTEGSDLSHWVSPSITNTDTLDLDAILSVVRHNQSSESWDIMSGITFSEDVEVVLSKGWVQLEESDKEDLEILDGINSIVWSFVSTDRKTDSDWTVKEQEVVVIVPGNVVQDWLELTVLVSNGERTDFFVVTSGIRATWTTLEPKDQRSGVVKVGILILGSSSWVIDVEDLGLGVVVDGEVTGGVVGKVGVVETGRVDNGDFWVVEVGVDGVETVCEDGESADGEEKN